MVGNAVDTIVWSRAARSIPAISALNTVRISRWLNAGGWGLVSGTAFIVAPYNQYACGMQRTAVDQEVAERVRTAWRELRRVRSEEHTSELQSLMRISYAVFCLTKTNNQLRNAESNQQTTSYPRKL